MALSSGVKSQIPFAGAFTGLQAGIARMKPRERLMLGGMVLLMLGGGAYYAYTLVVDAKSADAQAQADLQTARSGSTGALAKQVKIQTDDVRSWTWVAETPAIGRVIMEDQLAGLALRAGMGGATVKASDKPELIGGVNFIDVSVEAPFSWSGLSGFLSGLEGLGKGFVVNSVSVSDDVAPKLRIVVRMPLATTPPSTRPICPRRPRRLCRPLRRKSP